MHIHPAFPPQESEKWFKSLENGKCSAADNKRLVKQLSTIEGEAPYNRGKNRYPNVLPYDSTRVILRQEAQQTKPGFDYINANYIQVPNCLARYIATQAPLPKTFNDFWRMVYEARSSLILVLTKKMEGTVIKYHTYWPKTIESPFEFTEDNIKIEFLSEKTSLLSPDIIVTYLSLTYITPFGDRESFPVTQIRFEGWPDFGVPSHPDTLLTLIDIYRTELLLTQEKYIGTPGPPIIHCSAGVGRTGTFCAIDSALYLLESWPEEPDLVVHIVNTFRQQRMLTVQSYPQFCFVYKVLNYFTSCRPRKLDM